MEKYIVLYSYNEILPHNGLLHTNNMGKPHRNDKYKSDIKEYTYLWWDEIKKQMRELWEVITFEESSDTDKEGAQGSFLGCWKCFIKILIWGAITQHIHGEKSYVILWFLI